MDTQEITPQRDSANRIGWLIPVSVIWQRKWSLALWVVAGVVLGGAYLIFAGPSCEVAARVLIEDVTNIIDQNHGWRQDKDRELLATQREIIRSPAILQSVIHSTRPVRSGVENSEALADILSRLRVDPILGTDVLSIRYTGTAPAEALATVEAVISSYRSFVKQHEQEAHQETASLLRERQRVLQVEIAQLHLEFQQLRQKGPLMGQGTGVANTQLTFLNDLSRTLANTQSRRLQLENHLQTLTLASAPSLTTTPASQTVVPASLILPETPRHAGGWQGTEQRESFGPRELDFRTLAETELLARIAREGSLSITDPTPIQQAIVAAQAEEANLTQRFGPKHPDVKAVRQRIETLRAIVEQTVATAPERLEQELRALRVQESRLNELYSQELAAAKRGDEFLVREQQLTSDIDHLRSLQNTVTAELQHRELLEQAARQGNLRVAVRVLDGPALIPRELAASPKLILSLFSALGLACGLVVIAAREQNHHRSAAA